MIPRNQKWTNVPSEFVRTEWTCPSCGRTETYNPVQLQDELSRTRPSCRACYASNGGRESVYLVMTSVEVDADKVAGHAGLIDYNLTGLRRYRKDEQVMAEDARKINDLVEWAKPGAGYELCVGPSGRIRWTSIHDEVPDVKVRFRADCLRLEVEVVRGDVDVEVVQREVIK